ncbi:hypothetical protein ACIQ9Q_33750 [Streptomyces sp. NPDC094438]|uniref:hypothetical protein n=1 Tax=Streptomyces sp. NPDC094438 TaxID=3366061 RepID=UPI00381C1B22
MTTSYLRDHNPPRQPGHRAFNLGDRLTACAVEVFVPKALSDQRAKGVLYLRGLLLEAEVDAADGPAAGCGSSEVAVAAVSDSSTWPVIAVQERLARRAVAEVRPQVRVVDDTEGPARTRYDFRVLPQTRSRLPARHRVVWDYLILIFVTVRNRSATDRIHFTPLEIT